MTAVPIWLRTSLRTPPDRSERRRDDPFGPCPPPPPLCAGAGGRVPAGRKPVGAPCRPAPEAPARAGRGRAGPPGFSAPPTSRSHSAHPHPRRVPVRAGPPRGGRAVGAGRGPGSGAVRGAAASPLLGPCPPGSPLRPRPLSVRAGQPKLVPAAARLVPGPRALELRQPRRALDGARPPHLLGAHLGGAASTVGRRGERLGQCACASGGEGGCAGECGARKVQGRRATACSGARVTFLALRSEPAALEHSPLAPPFSSSILCKCVFFHLHPLCFPKRSIPLVVPGRPWTP